MALKFYKFSNKAIRNEELPLKEQMTIFIKHNPRSEDAQSFIIDPYRRCFFTFEITDFEVAIYWDDPNILTQLKKTSHGEPYGFYKDSYYDEITLDSIINKDYTNIKKTFFKEYSKLRLIPYRQKQLIRFSFDTKILEFLDDEKNKIDEIFIPNSFINPFYVGDPTRKQDYKVGEILLGWVSPKDVDIYKNNADKLNIYSNGRYCADFCIEDPNIGYLNPTRLSPIIEEDDEKNIMDTINKDKHKRDKIKKELETYF